MMTQPSVAYEAIRVGENGTVFGALIPPFSTPSVVSNLHIPETQILSTQHNSTVDALDEPVKIEDGKIVANPGQMIQKLGYPIVFEGRHWWVENVNGDIIRYHRGPKA